MRLLVSQRAVPATLAFLLVVGGFLRAAPLEVFVQYDHQYFVSFWNVVKDESWKTATIWAPKDETAWPRWTFWYQVERNGVLLNGLTTDVRMLMKTDVPINLDLWHKPPIAGEYPTYMWTEVPGNSDLTFSMAVNASSSPGVVFERRAEPEVVPSGVSNVRIITNVTVVGLPTVNGEPVSPQGGFIQVFLHAWKSEWLRIRSCRVDWTESYITWGPLQVNTDRYSGDGFYAHLNFGGVPIGQSFPLVLDLEVENLSKMPLYFRPVVEINWLFRSAEDSGPEGSHNGQSVVFSIPGPNGETLVTTIYCMTDEIMRLTYKPFTYHGSIWAYWPQVIEPVEAPMAPIG